MNTICYNPGLGVSQYSLSCSGMSELKAKVFGRRRKDVTAAMKITEPKYSSKVLEGNWFEERVERSPLPEITPISQEVARRPVKRDLRENFRIARMIRDKSRGMTRDLLVDHHSAGYHDNFSTVYDLTYRYLPQGLDGPRIRSYNSRINKWVPEQDLTKNFGNITGYGMKEYIRALQEEFMYEEKPQSNYQCDFSRKKIPTDVKRFHKKRVDLNVPDLRHLNIDLDTCWSRYLAQEFQKKDLCRRVLSGRY